MKNLENIQHLTDQKIFDSQKGPLHVTFFLYIYTTTVKLRFKKSNYINRIKKKNT